MMKKYFIRIITLICLMCMLMPACAHAVSPIQAVEKFKLARSSATKHNFWLWSSEKYVCYAQWERVSGGLNFRIKMQNDFPYDSVDAYTFEISAKNVYEEPILLKSSDGEYCESLYYTGERTFRPGTNGYTEYFRLRASEKIRYVYVKLIKYHTDEGTVYVDESHQTEYNWKIN